MEGFRKASHIFIICLVENPILNQYGHDKVLEPAVDDLSTSLVEYFIFREIPLLNI